MRVVQMTLDEELVERVDAVVRELGTTRSAFTRAALRNALERRLERSLDEAHRRGYEQLPVAPGEFDVWESEQAFGDEW